MPQDSPPYYEPPLEGRPERISKNWYNWLDTLRGRVDDSPQAVETVTLPVTSHAAISATPILVTLTAGLYRVSWYLRITTAAGTSSSVTVTIGWTETAVPLTFSGPAVTGNTTSTVQSQTFLLRSDGAAPITYAVAYASNPAGIATYRLDVVVESVAP